MTPERLEKLVLAGNCARLAEELAPLGEKERRALSKAAATLYRSIRKAETTGGFSGRLLAFVGRDQASLMRNAFLDSALAVLGVCPLSVVKSVQLWFMDSERNRALLKILLDRKPEWTRQWLERELEREFTLIPFSTVRRLVREGVCERPESDGYIRLFAHTVEWRDRNQRLAVPRREALLQDKELLEHEVWKLFEVETRAFANDYWEDGPGRIEGYESWKSTLLALQEQGHLERVRLLDASLRALSSGLPPHILTGFREFHAALAPTLEEIEARQEEYLHLLSSPTGHVVSFSLDALAKIEKAERLDGRQFLALAPAVFGVGTKGTARAVLKTAKRLVSRDRSLMEPAFTLALGALTHPSNDIQSQAVELVTSWRDGLPPDFSSRLRAQMDHLSPAARSQLAQWLDLASKVEPTVEGESVDVEADLERLRATVEHLDERTRLRLGLSPNPLGPDGPRWPAPLDLDVVETRVLEDAEPLERITEVETLIDRVAHAVEVVDSPEEIELILDGISRLCGQRLEHFGKRTHALRERVRAMGASEFATGLVMSTSVTTTALKDLLLTWLTGKRSESKLARWVYRQEAFAFAEQRIQEIADRVATGREAALLATPTHRHGWLSPTSLVERLRSLDPETAIGHRADFTQALLRLAPDGRKAALVEAASLTTPWAPVLRFALGGEEGPSEDDRNDYALWLAAARARDPEADFRDELSRLSLEDDLPDGLEPARYTWEASLNRQSSYGQSHALPQLKVVVATSSGVPADGSRNESRASVEIRSTNSLLGSVTRLVGGRRRTRWEDVPTHIITRTTSRSFWRSFLPESEWLIQWLALTWPLDPESIFAAGARTLAARVNESSSTFWPNHAYLDPLFVPGRPWGEMARLVLTVALVSKDADAATLAADALIEGIEDGRAHPELFASTLLRLTEGDWVKPNRLAASLSTAAQVSELHALFVAKLTDAFLAGLTPYPKNLHHLLELQWNLTLQLGFPPSLEARERLAAVRGSGKTAKLARKIASAQYEAKSPTAIARAIEARLAWVSRISLAVNAEGVPGREAPRTTPERP